MAIIFSESVSKRNPDTGLFESVFIEYDDTNPDHAQAIQEYNDHMVALKLDNSRVALKNSLRNEALTRIKTLLPDVEKVDDLKDINSFMAGIAPSAKAANNPVDKANAVRTTMDTELAKMDAMTQADFDAYDVTTDPGWPA